MKKSTTISLLFSLVLIMCFMLSGCGAYNKGEYYPMGFDNNVVMPNQAEGAQNYQYGEVVEHGFNNVSENSSSYFSLDRNTACYSYVRKQIEYERHIDPKSVRTEELINYFDYGFPAPQGNEDVKLSAYLSDCPWNNDSKILTVGARTKNIQLDSNKNNFVLLIDVSGSMHGNDRLELVKYGVNRLIDNLSAEDRISVVTYASSTGIRLESTLLTSEGKDRAREVINALDADGSTNGEGGIELAYSVAERQKGEGINSRVILMTDGDFNVGRSDITTMKEFIQDKAKGGVYLSVLGFGMGNTRDDMMQTLAMNGNGNYAYIDSTLEAEKVFTEELNGMLVAVLKDAKAGVTFNDNVKRYRLIGYDSKIITEEEFNDQKTDTGEVGSNLCVTMMYEVELSDGVTSGSELADVEVRYKSAHNGLENMSVKIAVTNDVVTSDNIVFASCVAEFGLVIRNSEYKGNASLNHILERLSTIKDYVKKDIYKVDFENMVAKAVEYMG